ncbi:hypothetical protein BP6252_10922 [Coleophoma cylindrospora]|uniref:Uncharacterized protein n=1 Tax=Coleophoma cylindrospora TaxID=1849047 RepID=A0A3D8QNK9_9HELO|nr:hypothetical protein BP6252_10922 [Coleophoma cylindrospora]
MAQMRVPCADMTSVPQFSESELERLREIAHSKGLSMTALAEALQAHERLQCSTKQTANPRHLIRSYCGYDTILPLHVAYQQPLPSVPWPNFMPFQDVPTQLLRSWLPADSTSPPFQELAQPHPYEQNPAVYLQGGLPVNPNYPPSTMAVAAGTPHSIDPHDLMMALQDTTPDDFNSTEWFATPYSNQSFSFEDSLEQLFGPDVAQGPQTSSMQAFNNTDNEDNFFSEWSQQSPNVSTNVVSPAPRLGGQNETHGFSITGTTRNNPRPQTRQEVRPRQRSQLVPILARESPTNTESLSSTSSTSTWAIPTPSSESDRGQTANSPPHNHNISRAPSNPSVFAPCQYEWTIPKRVG